MREILRFRSEAGIDHVFRKDDAGNVFDIASQDTTAVLDRNKAMATHNDGYTPSRELRRVATIPAIVQLKWRIEEGLDIYNPEHADRLAKKLNDPEWAHLRTAPGHLGVSNGVMR